MAKAMVGIDLGTTSTKLLVIDDQGRLLAEMALPSALISRAPGWAEADPGQWWENCCRGLPAVLSRAGLQPSQVAAVGLSGMVPTLILLDSGGRVLRPSIQQNDARAVEEIASQRARTDETDILRRTGSAITQQSIGPKLLWLRHHEPELFSQACHAMGSYDYLVYRLTGQFSAERNWALESGLFDLQRQDWDDGLLELAGIPRDWLGEVHWPAEVAGTVGAQAARECGLAAGTPVVAGSADHIASAFSAGVHAQGDLLVKLGGAGDILCCLEQAEVDPRLYLDYHVIPGKFLINGCMAASGSLIRWYRDQFAHGQDYADLDRAAQSIPAGSDGLVLLPYFLGEKTPIHDPLARGTVIGLSLAHTKAHLYRAILEGISYGFNHHLRVLGEHHYRAGRVRVTNGGAHSLLWRQITADVLGLPLELVASHPGSSLGAAFIAGKGLGIFSAWEDIERYITIESVTQPDLKAHRRYQELFEVYLATYQALQPLYPRLAREVTEESR